MPSQIDTVMRQFRRQVLGRDTATLAMLSRRWGEVERALQDEIDALASEAVEAERAGDTVNHAAWRRMARYQELERQARRVIERYESWAEGVIEGGQRDYFEMGEAFAVEAMNARGTGLAGSFNRMPVTAVNEMIGMSGDGSPLFDVLKQRALAEASIDGLQRALNAGMAAGMNPRETARAMAEGLQAGLQKALVIARTEQLRAYRRATIQSYQANADVVSGYEWVSALDPRTCAACWSMHGRFFPLGAEMPNDHICGRCTFVPVIRSRDERVKSGEERFGELSENQQKTVLGPGRYDLYRRGVPFEQFGRLRPDATWGPTLELTPLKTLRLEIETAFYNKLHHLDKDEILTVGEMPTNLLTAMRIDIADNLNVVITGERRNHYLDRHREILSVEKELQNTLLNPDFASPNRSDPYVVILYHRISTGKTLRAAVRLQPERGLLKHSVMSVRFSTDKEIKKDLNRAIYQREK